MTELKRILGTSVFSVLLVTWGLFMVCSGRVPDINYDDEMFAEEEFFDESSFEGGIIEGETQDDENFMDQLAVLEEESPDMDNSQRNEILEALGITNETTGSELSRGEDEAFLDEEMFLDLEVEIAELEKIASLKDAVAESLRMEAQEADYQLNALSAVVVEPVANTGTSRTAPTYSSSGASASQFGSNYQDALNDIYSRNFSDAIAKFRNLLKQMEPSDNLADNCQYWIGEAFYAMGKYEEAVAEFEKVFAFDTNNKTDDAQFMIGMSNVRTGDSMTARIELENLMNFYQDSEYLARAQKEFGDLNM